MKWNRRIVWRLIILLSVFVLLSEPVSTRISKTRSKLKEHKKRHSMYKLNLRKVYVRNAKRVNASCLDGSDAAFYISRNRKNRNWVIRLQAGGSCVLFSECYDRKTTAFGSSKYLQNSITGTFLTSDDPNINPTFNKWNKVFIPYCSGDLFVGRKHARDHGFGLPMLGHYIVTSVVRQLIQDYKINTKHTKILFGGASAGGIGMLSNIDHVAKMVRPARVLGYNDGGWFTLYRNYLEPSGSGAPEFLSTLRFLFKNYWDGFVDESCRAQMPQPAACLYGEMVIRHLSTPIFVMVSLWDSYQLKELNLDKYRPVHLPPSSHKEALYLAQFGNNTYKSIRRLLNSNRSGVFSPACVSHTFAGVNETEAAVTMKYKIAGVTPYQALSEWYNTRGRRGTYADVPVESPRCNPTCCSKYCSRCSRASEMLVVSGKRHTHDVETQKLKTEIVQSPTTITSGAERLRMLAFVYGVLLVLL